MIKPGSQNARILAALADGQWHTTADLYATVGGCSLNSRIAELRSMGYRIPCQPVDGVPAGPEAQRYLLAGTPEEGASSAAFASSSGVSVTTAVEHPSVFARAGGDAETSHFEQLELVA